MTTSPLQQFGKNRALLIPLLLALLYTPLCEAIVIRTSDPTIIVDTSTQLEWLTPTLSVGRSYDEMNAVLGSGISAGPFAGFRYAAPVELFALLQTMGLTVDGTPQPGELAAANHFLSLFGTTGTQTPSGAPMKSVVWGITDSTLAGLQATGGILMQLTDIPRTFCGCFEPPFVIGGLQDPSQPEAITGSWLVRSTAQTVPEPGTWALVGLALLGFTGQRYRQKIAEVAALTR